MIFQITNYGVNSTDHLIHVDLNGIFSGTDTVVVECENNDDLKFNIVNQTSQQIRVSFAPLNDTCYFSVQDGPNNSDFQAVLLSLSQNALFITSVIDSGISSANMLLENVTLLGKFSGSNDLVTAACDGQSFTPVTAVRSNSGTSILLTMPRPKNFYSCHFAVSGSGAQSPTYSVLIIKKIKNGGVDPQNTSRVSAILTGNFGGTLGGVAGQSNSFAQDQVWESCDGAVFSKLTSALVLDDDVSQINILLPKPVSFGTCQFYISVNNYESPIFVMTPQ